jgi:hypothetical protein
MHGQRLSGKPQNDDRHDQDRWITDMNRPYLILGGTNRDRSAERRRRGTPLCASQHYLYDASVG